MCKQILRNERTINILLIMMAIIFYKDKHIICNCIDLNLNFIKALE